MSIRIHGNVTGTPTDIPRLLVDTGAGADGDLSVPGRVTFSLPDGTPPHGATVFWDHQQARTVIAQQSGVPLEPGDYEGSSLVVPMPPLVYVPQSAGLRTVGDRFVTADGRPWTWIGATDMLLPARLQAGESIEWLLDQRQAAGINLVRCLAMGYPFWPVQEPTPFPTVQRFFEITKARGLYVEWVVFAGTRFVMPNPFDQQAFYAQTLGLAAQYPHVLIELCNEWNHGSQMIDPSLFQPPTANLGSHGSGLTDAPPVLPVWQFATYHPRRDRPPDARGFTNYDAYEFQADWPKPCPFIPDEGIKPPEYGFDPAWAAQLGRHAGIGAGGTFHSQEGVQSEPWNPQTAICAKAFADALKG